MTFVTTSAQHDDQVLNAIVNRMVETHGCHTVLLYGSRASDEFEPTSDYDVCGFRDAEEAICDCEILSIETVENGIAPSGIVLDAWVYPTSLALEPDQSLLRLRDARVLLEKDGLGTTCIENVKKLFASGPPILPEWEKQKRLVWMRKTLARTQKGDLEGQYRVLWLLHLALEYYFELRQQWYCGSKASFKWLEENDKQFLAKFKTALANPFDPQALAAVIEGVAP